MQNKRGGARPNSGRLKKDEVISLIETMDSVLVPIKVWEELAKKVKEQDVIAIKTWLGYRFGMPTQVVKQTNINIEETDLNSDEIKRIKNELMNEY